jgi:hypothetical protein
MNLSVMSETEAKKLGVPEDRRRFFVKAMVTKNNYAPPQAEAIWLELGIHGNLTRATLDTDGDSVGSKLMELLVATVTADKAKGIERTRTGFANHYAGTNNIFKMGDKSLRTLISDAIKEGCLIEQKPCKSMHNVKFVLAVPDHAKFVASMESLL